MQLTKFLWVILMESFQSDAVLIKHKGGHRTWQNYNLSRLQSNDK